jgi:pyruvate,orthophosphate dikinase
MAAAAALVTTLGGIMSHAAVVARGWAIPAVCSIENAEFVAGGLQVGDLLIREGDPVTVDGAAGLLYLGDQREEGALDLPELQKLREWAGEGPAGGQADGAEVTPFEVLRVLSLKGLCTADRAAAILGAREAAVAAILEAHGHFLKQTPRGVALTAEGRAWVMEQLSAERASIDSPALEPAFQDFLPLNQRFKAMVSGAQLSGITSSEHADWPPLLEALQTLHDDFRPLVERVGGVAPRLAGYCGRFDAALEAFAGGDHSFLASPLKDSYHTVWFEFHEELIALTGRDRAIEEAAGH